MVEEIAVRDLPLEKSFRHDFIAHEIRVENISVQRRIRADPQKDQEKKHADDPELSPVGLS